jgi:hypothetical protein
MIWIEVAAVLKKEEAGRWLLIEVAAVLKKEEAGRWLLNEVAAALKRGGRPLRGKRPA